MSIQWNKIKVGSLVTRLLILAHEFCAADSDLSSECGCVILKHGMILEATTFDENKLLKLNI